MIIAGAGSAGKETLAFYVTTTGKTIAEIYDKTNKLNIYFYDTGKICKNYLYDIYPILKTKEELQSVIMENPDFCVAIGHPRLRERMFNHILQIGGHPKNIIRHDSVKLFSEISEGQANIIYPNVCISFDFCIGKSCIIHANSAIGHCVTIGNFVNIGPLCSVIGPCEIGDFSYIGAGSVILPNCKIGRNVIVSAGSVVNRDVADYETFC